MVDTKDRAALNASIQDNLRRLSRFLLPRVGSPDVAADIAQESYVRMLASYGPASIAEKPALLVRIAHNIVRERARKIKRTDGGVSVSFDELDAQLADPLSSETPESKLNAWLLKRAILNLPPRCKEVFVLHRFKGMSYPEIADFLGISRDTVKEHIVRAMRDIDKHFVD